MYGLHAVREALRAGTRPLQRLLVLRTDRQFSDLVHQARSQHVPVHIEPPAAFDRLVPDQRHQGIIAFIAAKGYCSTDEILEHARRLDEPPFLVILDGVEDPHNLGAVLRTAEAAGVHGIFIPERRAVGLTPVVAKVSAGALDHMRVARVVNLSRLIEELKGDGVWVYGVEPSAPISVTTIDMTGPVAFVFGGEGGGIRHGVLQECDGRVRIPMKGKVASLNVSAAVAVTLFEGVRQRSAPAQIQRPIEPE
ncbi:MAG TPA: 23S rRNA (guanosine(2251)-2'-O)-methyltransferase RlmB [Nitrospira sp.]|nr:23S rRNA (guanosine(2251)-2'-O)-methyltransferase RlmB [Nitrospira sp.]